MPQFAVIEVDDGLTVTELEPGALADQVAAQQGGSVADPGPYQSYEEAYDALLALLSEDDEDDQRQ